MEVITTFIEGVLLLKPRVFRDPRGYFMETFNENVYREAGIDHEFVQDNFSRSNNNVLRGLHLQDPYAQGKLVRVAWGRVFDVAVDLRKDSSTYGKWYGAILDDQECHQLWIPPGCGHGFLTLSDIVDFEYKCTDFYHPECEICIRWDDPTLSVEWPFTSKPTISDKDSQGMSFLEYGERF